LDARGLDSDDDDDPEEANADDSFSSGEEVDAKVGKRKSNFRFEKKSDTILEESIRSNKTANFIALSTNPGGVGSGAL
jgi:hypothetical protein